MPTIEIALDLETLTCYSCGITFAVAPDWIVHRRRDHAPFFCPNGHGQAFLDRTKEQREIERLTKRTAQLEEEVRLEAERARGLERKNTRLANDLMDHAKEAKRVHDRIHAGVCPACHRHFQNVERHMKSRHSGPAAAAAQAAAAKGARK